MNLEERILLINERLSNVDNSRVTLAMELFNARRDVYWKDTKYKFFKTFCTEEVALSHSKVFVYLNVVKLSIANKFNVSDMSRIVDTIGWSRFRIGLSEIGADEIITVAQFLTRYKNLNLNSRVTYESGERKLVDFQFCLPKESAEILTNELIIRGMRVTNKSRINISSAMVKLVKELLEQEEG